MVTMEEMLAALKAQHRINGGKLSLFAADDLSDEVGGEVGSVPMETVRAAYMRYEEWVENNQ